MSRALPPQPAADLDLPLVAVVAHARSVPVAARTAFADAVRPIATAGRAAVVQTCHRVEIYATADNLDGNALGLPAGGRRLRGLEVARHLIAEACGLDSVILGETQILHQLREALATRHADRRHESRLDPRLDRLFQVALRAGREARTHLDGPPRSLADAGLDRLEGAPVRTPAQARRVLVVGAGRMGRLAAIAAARRGHDVIVASRTADRAAALAHQVGGRLGSFEATDGLEAHDGVVIALAGPWPVAAPVLRTLPEHALVVDLSAPPALDEPARDALGRRYLGVDDLADEPEGIPSEGVRRRLRRIAEGAEDDYLAWLRRRHSASTIEAIVAQAEEQRRRELEWLRRRVPDMPPEAVAAVERMSQRLVGGMLHAPLSVLNDDGSDDLEPAARELFRV